MELEEFRAKKLICSWGLGEMSKLVLEEERLKGILDPVQWLETHSASSLEESRE